MGKKLIVVGGGYGGTEVLRQLVLRGVRDIDIELISNKRHFENTIGCTEIISEKVKVEELTYDLKELSNYWNFELTIGNIESIDLNKKKVRMKNKEKDYDILVVSAGSESNFYDVKGAEFATSTYTLSDFRVMNERLKNLDVDKPNIVIAGAGLVGLEVVAETLDLFNNMKKEVEVTVVEKMNSVLPLYNNDLCKEIAFEHFTSRGVKIILGKGVKKIEKDKVILEDGSNIEADITFWSAGIKGSKLASNIVGANLHNGYIDVDEKLLIRGRKDAFAIGDIAFVKIDGQQAQKMAGEALEQAKTVAKNIRLIVNNKKPNFKHSIDYTTDFPKALLSIGEGKAILIFGPQIASIGYTEYFLKKRIDFDEIMGRFP
ncbi:MAG: NAD(P)/FAD-dependent oxidoreductase [Candidatus Lokiarchaeia archaeon]